MCRPGSEISNSAINLVIYGLADSSELGFAACAQRRLKWDHYPNGLQESRRRTLDKGLEPQDTENGFPMPEGRERWDIGKAFCPARAYIQNYLWIKIIPKLRFFFFSATNIFVVLW